MHDLHRTTKFYFLREIERIIDEQIYRGATPLKLISSSLEFEKAFEYIINKKR